MSFSALAEDYLQRGGKALVERSQEEVSARRSPLPR